MSFQFGPNFEIGSWPGFGGDAEKWKASERWPNVERARRVHEKHAQTGDDTLCGSQDGSTLAATIEDV